MARLSLLEGLRDLLDSAASIQDAYRFFEDDWIQGGWAAKRELADWTLQVSSTLQLGECHRELDVWKQASKGWLDASVGLVIQKAEQAQRLLEQIIAVLGGEPGPLMAAMSRILNRGPACHEATQWFADKRHDELVNGVRDYLELHRSALGPLHLEITHTLNDRGTDLLVRAEDCKVGFQIKSSDDVKEDDFLATVKRQIEESRAHRLDRWYLLICSPLGGGHPDYSVRIKYCLNELSQLEPDYVEAYGPENTIKLFRDPTPLSRQEVCSYHSW